MFDYSHLLHVNGDGQLVVGYDIRNILWNKSEEYYETKEDRCFCVGAGLEVHVGHDNNVTTVTVGNERFVGKVARSIILALCLL